MDEQAVINKLLAGDEATFQQLLEAMQSHENEHRQAGEKVFNFLRDSHYDVVVKLLLNGLGSRNADVQLYSTVYLRKVLSSTHDAQRLLSGALDPGTIKTQLLGVLSRVESMTHKTIENVCYTIVQVSSLFLGEEGQPWPELLKVVEECCSVEAAGQRVFTGITLFNELIQMLPDSAGPWILSLMQPLSTFMDKGTSAIKVAAVAAATSVLLEKCDDKDVVGHYKQLIPWALKALSDLLQAGDESSAQDVMQQLISISEETEDGAGWFRDNFVETANAMLTVARQEHLEADTRKLAVEVVMAILEQKPSMIRRRFLSLVGPLFELCMVFLLDVEDDQEWYDSQDEQGEDAGEGELFGSAQEWLDRMAIKLGGKIMLHAAGPCITTWASDADWRKRHAVLICLAQIAEGCAKVMKKSYLGELAQQCVVGLTDSHPRVRWSACQAVGQLCTDLGPEFQDEQHQLLLEGGLMKAMEDFQHQRVVAHATAALVNFSDNCEREMLAVYLPAIIPKLVALLPNYDRAPPRRVQEGSLTAIASMADCSQAEFKPYYDAVMPTLIHVFENANGKKDQMLRAKALECISLVGMAVGKEQFGAQALYLMDRIQALLGVQLDPDDQLLSYMQQAGARICKCLGRDFQPYLPIVIPALMKSASRQDVEHNVHQALQSVETCILGSLVLGELYGAQKVDPDDPRLEALQEDESYHVIPLASNTALVINTDISEEKANALNLLCCYIDELRDLFFPYLNELLPIAIDNCRENVLSFETKQAAVKLLPDLLICAMAAMQSNNHQEATLQNVTTLGQQIWQVLCGMQKYDLHIAQKTNNPGDAQLSSTVLEALDGVLEHLEPSMLPMETIQETVSLVQEVLVHVQKRRLDLSKRKDDDEVDEEEVEMIANEDEVEKEVIEQVETLLGTMLRKYREAVFPLMQPIATLFASMVQSSDPDEKRIAILFIDDVVENVPNSCQGLVDNMINILAESIAPGTDADTCQSAVYGLSVIASKREYDHAFKPKCLQVLQVMLSQQRDSENEMALDNATAALGKILMHHRDALGEHAPTVCAAWLGHLPVLADEVEGQAMHAALLDATLQRDQLVLGDNNCNVARIAEIFLQVLARSDTLLEESRQPQMVSCYMQLRGQPGVQAVEQAVLPKLSESQQSRLKQAMGM